MENERDHRKKKREKKRETCLKARLAVSAAFFILSAAMMIMAARNPEFSEWYAKTVYPVFTENFGRLWGMFPFSVSEAGLYVLLCGTVLSLARGMAGAVRPASGKEGKRRRKDAVIGAAASWFSGVLLTAGILALLYTMCCGINYHRPPFSEEEEIATYRYSAGELKAVCEWLTDEVNNLSGEVKRDENGVMELDAPEGDGAVEAMNRLAEKFPSLKGYYPRPKKLAVSELLSYQGLTGIYSPFTVEANYNGDMTAYNIPFTACHELSHLRGFMQEEEANFIGFLACISSDRRDFRYSGYLSGWVYCMNALYRADYESWVDVRSSLNEETEKDLAANSEFWEHYEGFVSETADQINDTYLKANGQADGVKSYGRMADLIVAYYGKSVHQ